MELIHVREFQDNKDIEKEYNDGIIVVAIKPSVRVWDVHNNTVRPITNHPGTLNNSVYLAHFYNYAAIFCKDNQSEIIQLIKKYRRENSHADFRFVYCDGVQAFRIYDSPRGFQLFRVDLIQKM